jgi:hypothetical protein
VTRPGRSQPTPVDDDPLSVTFSLDPPRVLQGEPRPASLYCPNHRSMTVPSPGGFLKTLGFGQGRDPLFQGLENDSRFEIHRPPEQFDRRQVLRDRQ